MGFKKQISCDEFLLTGIDKDGNVIAQVNQKIYAPFEQTTDKIRINKNGKLIETRKSIRKSNYRNNFKNKYIHSSKRGILINHMEYRFFQLIISIL